MGRLCDQRRDRGREGGRERKKDKETKGTK